MCACGSIFSIKFLGVEAVDDHVARGEAEHAVQFENRGLEFGARRDILGELRIGLEQELSLGAQHVDHREVVAPADLEIVEVVGRRDLHRARALLGVGIFVSNNGNAAAHQRQDHVLADHVPVTLIVGMHGNGGVAQHGLGPRGGDHDEGGWIVGVERRPLDRIAQMPEMPLGVELLDLEIGNGGEQLGVPIDEALVLVDEARAIEIDEHLTHGAGQALVHGESEPRPVAGAAEPLQLADDGVARLFFPLPHALDEGLAAHGAAVGLLPFQQLTLDHHLGGDAGVIGARLPQHVAPAHALEADEHVLQRVVEGMPHMERAGDVGRRNDNGERPGLGARGRTGGEGGSLLPGAIGFAFDLLRLIGLVEHGCGGLA